MRLGWHIGRTSAKGGCQMIEISRVEGEPGYYSLLAGRLGIILTAPEVQLLADQIKELGF